jgi:hypothetical protein
MLGLLLPVLTMSAKNPPAATANHMFIPQPFEPIQVDKITIKLYPIGNSTMKPPDFRQTRLLLPCQALTAA